MTEDDKKIKRGPPKHNPACYQLQRDIVIPAGTIFREAAIFRGSTTEMSTIFGLGGAEMYLAIDDEPATVESGYFKKVIAL